jgi:H+/Cl- antiporter ClcA
MKRAVAATVMILEMTHQYGIAFPLTITVARGRGMRRFLLRESIYTMKLS